MAISTVAAYYLSWVGGMMAALGLFLRESSIEASRLDVLYVVGMWLVVFCLLVEPLWRDDLVFKRQCYYLVCDALFLHLFVCSRSEWPIFDVLGLLWHVATTGAMLALRSSLDPQNRVADSAKTVSALPPPHQPKTDEAIPMGTVVDERV